MVTRSARRRRAVRPRRRAGRRHDGRGDPGAPGDVPCGPGRRRGRRAAPALRRQRRAVGPCPAGAAGGAPAPLAAPAAPRRRRRRVLLPRRAHRRGHHRRHPRLPASGWASSTSTAPRGRPRRCTRRSATAAWSGATGDPVAVDVTDLVPGDVVQLAARRDGPRRPAPARGRRPRVRRERAHRRVPAGREDRRPGPDRCRAGRPAPRARSWAPSSTPAPALGVVVATGARAEFGRIAVGLASGSRRPSSRWACAASRCCCVQVAVVLTVAIFVINLLLQRPLLDALLFSLAIAVGITPQLLPAVVTHQPGDRLAPAGAQQGAGQAPGLHRGPRRHRRPRHRQDRHAHRGPDRVHPTPSAPTGRPATRRCASACCAPRPTVDRRGRRSAATRSTPRCGRPAPAASTACRRYRRARARCPSTTTGA